MCRSSATILFIFLMCLSSIQRVEGAESKLVKRDAAGRLVMLPWNERGRWGNGHGWSGNTTVFWNCAAPVIFALQPPLGQNFMIGNSDPKLYNPAHAKARISNQNSASGRNEEFCEGTLQGTAWKESPNERVTPRLLYYAQLEARLGKAAVENVTTAEQRRRSQKN